MCIGFGGPIGDGCNDIEPPRKLRPKRRRIGVMETELAGAETCQRQRGDQVLGLVG